MTASSSMLLTFTQRNSTGAKPIAPLQPPEGAASSQRFSNTLASALKAQSSENGSGDSAPDQVASAAGADERARQTLGLGENGEQGSTLGGDAVLDGLARLRGAVNSETSKLMSVGNAGALSSEGMLGVQEAYDKFSLLADVSTRVLGKTTQTLDTLLKGQ